jgi:PAS domain S-box-containing protein
MKERDNAKDQLIKDLAEIRRQVVPPKRSETERNRAEEEIKERERRFAEVADLLPQTLFECDRNGQITFINRGFLDAFGYTREDFDTGLNLLQMVITKDRDKARESLEKVLDGKEIKEAEFTALRKDGHPFPALVFARPIMRENMPVGCRGFVVNITARKRVEEALRESESRFRAIANYSYDCEFWLDPHGKPVWMNPAVVRLTGYAVEECMAMADFPLPLIYEEDRGRVAMLLGKAVRGTSAKDEEFRISCKDGSLKWAAVSWQPIYDVDGSPLGHRSSVRDITDRKQAEEKIRELNQELAQRVRELKATNDGLKTFTYSLSHDLRTPLFAIRGFSRRLLEKYAPHLDEKGQRYLKIINANSIQMEALIADLRAFLTLGKKTMKASRIRMGDTVQGIFHQLRALHPNRTIQLNMKTLPDAKGDEAMIRDVFTNLLDNAVKYSGRRDVAVIEVAGWIEEERTVYYVKDNGIGFPMEEANKLFEAFERLHTTEEIEGTGLGLAIVKRIIRRHGGDVWAEARVDKGATFYFSVPR